MHCHRGIIAIIDDDPLVRSSVHRLVTSLHLHAAQFASAREFLNLAASAKTTCAISDIDMPDGDAELLLSEGKAREPRLSVIFMTARPDRDRLGRLLAAGAVAVLSKPFDQNELVRGIARALELSGGAGQLPYTPSSIGNARCAE